MNVSRFSSDDPRLTAYALGELDPQEAAQVEAALRRDPVARQIVADIRATAAQLEAALAGEGSEANEPVATGGPIRSVGVSKDYAVLDLRYARKRMWGGLIEFPQWSQVLSAAAAAALIGFVLFFPRGYHPDDMRKQLVEAQRARAIAEARNAALREELDHYQKTDTDFASVDDRRSSARTFQPPRIQFQLPSMPPPKPEVISADEYRGLAKLDTLSTAVASADLFGESGGEDDDIARMDPFLAESDEDFFAMVNFAYRTPNPMTLANVLDWAKANLANAGDDPGGIHRDISTLTRRAEGVMQ